jgi:hypothetical protein
MAHVTAMSFALQPLAAAAAGLDHISAAQALGADIILASSDGDLLRVDGAVQTAQTIPGPKPVDDILILPSLSRLLVLAGAS